MNRQELTALAERKHKRLVRARRDPRYQAVVGAFLHAGLLRGTGEVPAAKARVRVKDVMWAGKIEPRLLELLPAVLIKKPGLVLPDELPADLNEVVAALRKNLEPGDFRGVSGKKIAEWLPRVGHRNKLPTQLKTFRLRKDDIDLLKSLARERSLSETDVVRAALRALSA